MKILILSASTGGGHMSAAKALKEYLESINETADIIDALEYINPFLNKTVTEIYEYLATKQPLIWKMMYKSSNNKALNHLVLSTNSIISKKLLPLIDEYKPDAIVTTHPFTTEMISTLKTHNIINIPLVCIMTDYAPHRTWINPGVDAYIVANEEMTTPMIEMDVKSEKIYPFGIPVDDSFFEKLDKNKTLKEIGLKSDIPTILIMAGSCGFANVVKIYNKLRTIKTDFQVIIITGKNKKLFEKMQNLVLPGRKSIKSKILSKFSDKVSKIKHLRLIKKIRKESLCEKETKIIYFTNEVNKYMSVSDLIITKPGGLTVSEALASNLPMALFDAIPGQEEENADFLVSNNMAVKIDSHKDVTQTIKELLCNPKKLSLMKYNCKNFDKSDSLKNITDIIKKLSNNA